MNAPSQLIKIWYMCFKIAHFSCQIDSPLVFLNVISNCWSHDKSHDRDIKLGSQVTRIPLPVNLGSQFGSRNPLQSKIPVIWIRDPVIWICDPSYINPIPPKSCINFLFGSFDTILCVTRNVSLWQISHFYLKNYQHFMCMSWLISKKNVIFWY
jgi:hypothetical protein